MAVGYPADKSSFNQRRNSVARWLKRCNEPYARGTSAPVSNPFDQVTELILTTLREQVEVAAVVRDVDRSIFGYTTQAGALDTVTQADVPRLLVRATPGSLVNLTFTSSDVLVEYNYDVHSEVGSKQLNNKAGDLNFGVLRALTRLQFSGALEGLLWSDDPYVTDVGVQSLNIDMQDAVSGRGIEGWMALWTLVVRMTFTRAKMILNSG